jgi:putative endopeptidase
MFKRSASNNVSSPNLDNGNPRFSKHVQQCMRLGALALCMVCAGSLQAQVDANPGVDTQIKPGDDFFAYANGAWLQGTPIPAGKDRVTARSELVDLVQPRVAKIMDDARTQPVGSLARMVGDFRASHLNVAAIEAAGLTPLQPLLKQIERLRDKAGLTRLLGQQLRADVDPVNQGTYMAFQ